MSKKQPNKIYSLPELVEYYELCNRSEGKSEKTIEWYTANLNRFCNYLKPRHLSGNIQNIDTRILREYVLYLMKQHKYAGHPCTPVKKANLSVASLHGHVRTLRAFFSWLVRESILADNPGRDLKPPRLTKKVVLPLTDDEIAHLFKLYSSSEPITARNQAILMVMLDTGLRAGELINLKTEDVHLKEGFLKVFGKGRKERVVPIGSVAQRALQRYLFRFRPKPVNQTISSVFLTIEGRPITINCIKLTFVKMAHKSSIVRLHAHLCRHTFATRFLINGGDVFSLQQILGHSSLEMVSRYVSLASSHIVVQHQRFSPLDRLQR